MNVKRWLRKHSLRLLAIRDTPESIAGGVAIGIFFGFAPIFGLKTVSAIFLAWITGSNILAALIAGVMHDLLLPVMPVIYRMQYDLGYWILSQPHHWPEALTKLRWEDSHWRSWQTLLSIGKPLLLGGFIFSLPWALLAFVVTRGIVAGHQRKRLGKSITTDDLDANPS